jgi:hypothetical protein
MHDTTSLRLKSLTHRLDLGRTGMLQVPTDYFNIKPLSRLNISFFKAFIYFTLLSVLPIKEIRHHSLSYAYLIDYLETDMRIALRV